MLSRFRGCEFISHWGSILGLGFWSKCSRTHRSDGSLTEQYPFFSLLCRLLLNIKVQLTTTVRCNTSILLVGRDWLKECSFYMSLFLLILFIQFFRWNFLLYVGSIKNFSWASWPILISILLINWNWYKYSMGVNKNFFQVNHWSFK